MRSRMQFVGVALLSFALGVLVSGNEVGKLFANLGTIGVGTAYADGDTPPPDDTAPPDKKDEEAGGDADKADEDNGDKADESGETDEGEGGDTTPPETKPAPVPELDPEIVAKLKEFATVQEASKDFAPSILEAFKRQLLQSIDAATRAIEEEKASFQRDVDAVKAGHDAELERLTNEVRDAARRGRERLEVVKRSLLTQAPGAPGAIAGGNYRGFGGDR